MYVVNHDQIKHFDQIRNIISHLTILNFLFLVNLINIFKKYCMVIVLHTLLNKGSLILKIFN